MKKVLLTILSVFIIGSFFIECSNWKRSFDSAQWFNPGTSEENYNLRWEMIGSLKLKHNLKGKSKDEILKIFGEPTIDNLNTWNYDLGPTGRGINYGDLELKFENGNCKFINVREH